MIDLLNIPAPEAERLAYSEGFKGTAELFARIADLEAQVKALEAELDEARDDSLTRWEKNHGPAEQYREFFLDCFQYLAGHYPAPSVTSDYDKSVIFDTIAKGAGE